MSEEEGRRTQGNEAARQPQDAGPKRSLRERRTFAGLFRYRSGIKEDGYDEKPDQATAPFRWATLKRFCGFVRPLRGLVAVACVCTLVNQALTVVMPLAIGRIVDFILPRQDAALLNVIAIGLVLFILIRSGYVYLEQVLVGTTGELLVKEFRHGTHAHFLGQSVDFIEKMNVGRAVSRILQDTRTVTSLLFGGFIQTASNCVRVVIIFFVLMFIHWKLTLVACFSIPFFVYGVHRLIAYLRPAYREISEDFARLHARAGENLNGIKVVKTYAGEHREKMRFLNLIHRHVRKHLVVYRLQVVMAVIWELSAGLGTTALLWYGGHEVMVGNLSVGQLVAFLGLIALLFQPIAALINLSASVQQAMASIERIFEVLDTPPSIRDKEGAVEPGALRGEIAFEDVSFRYDGPEGKKAALDRISFRADPGQCVAFVGPSGAGKTTVTNLLARFYDAGSGRVLVDGRDIRDYRLAAYHGNIGMVLQETFLFCGTIRQNIAYGRPQATEEEIVRAAKMANAWDFIRENPKGLDTYVGERGAKLSGGQKQRIAIARAIVANPRILILDEATSALDSQAESQIQEALDELMRGRTSFVIAHRLSTITNADKIVVLDGGRIVETGTHEELLAAKGKYYEMFMEQYGKVRFSQTTAEAILAWRRGREEKKAARRAAAHRSSAHPVVAEGQPAKNGRRSASGRFYMAS